MENIKLAAEDISGIIQGSPLTLEELEELTWGE
jgi:hypothetical protein